jgi:hypothetical protein
LPDAEQETREVSSLDLLPSRFGLSLFYLEMLERVRLVDIPKSRE